ncbi:ADP-ribosylglycohydrolase family protein [Microbacterium sp. SORGH_AS_0862]|uniref:ADP-ribosylglycohydrolase family protein n=1 Tax=Microbacterium sp. SORGH_AS_0862 TaxID=3041789 RepID=UPI002792A370|nr:ADP-ribosylglycohydrolase family protein [Microbacterium sp. SORGH_AS_0862]MDQ1204493.1 ADP-ribosylglycohydrolase [Microbacterium sp. SORGH_AS_0862]
MLDDSALLARARAVLLGLAIGDALGAPADVHRSVRTPWVRGRLWAGSAELDAERVSRPLLPFAPTLDDARGISATDDTEEAVAAAICLLAADAGTDAGLFARWLAIHADRDAWLGVAARSAERNAARDALPALIRELSPRMYSHAGTVAETLPLALAVTMLAEAQASRAIPLSLAIARKADSLPAFVGAFCGALGGGAAPEHWSELDAVRGHLLPAVAGTSLDAVAADLAAHARRGRNRHRGHPRSENR